MHMLLAEDSLALVGWLNPCIYAYSVKWDPVQRLRLSTKAAI